MVQSLSMVASHRCALKFKAWVIEQWIEANVRGHARHAIGYHAGESKRIAKSEYSFRERIAFGFNADEIAQDQPQFGVQHA